MNRDTDACPVCGESFAKVESVVDAHGSDGRRYWHTDLPSYQQFCVEWCDGSTDQVDYGHEIYAVDGEDEMIVC